MGKGVNSQPSSGARAEDRERAFPRQRDEVDYLQLARHSLAGARGPLASAVGDLRRHAVRDV